VSGACPQVELAEASAALRSSQQQAHQLQQQLHAQQEQHASLQQQLEGVQVAAQSANKHGQELELALAAAQAEVRAFRAASAAWEHGWLAVIHTPYGLWAAAFQMYEALKQVSIGKPGRLEWAGEQAKTCLLLGDAWQAFRNGIKL